MIEVWKESVVACLKALTFHKDRPLTGMREGFISANIFKRHIRKALKYFLFPMYMVNSQPLCYTLMKMEKGEGIRRKFVWKKC